MSRNSSNYSTKTGLTLIEVLAALALLSTLLVGILLAGHRHTGQIRRSRQALDVLHRVDELMYRWMATDGLIPREATGRLPGEEEFLWKTRVVSQDHAESLRIDVVRLEVFSRREASSDRPLVALDLAVPAAQRPPRGE
jgi:prepilin-type N-terminal cleavage/methylation domain-containing protein